MPIDYEIRPEIDCIFVTLTGVIEDADLLTAQREMFTDSLFVGHYTRLIDASACDRLAVDAYTVHSVAKAAEKRGLRRAALVAPDDVVYGLMRMYENYVADADCAVFRDIGDAIAWLAPARR